LHIFSGSLRSRKVLLFWFSLCILLSPITRAQEIPDSPGATFPFTQARVGTIVPDLNLTRHRFETTFRDGEEEAGKDVSGSTALEKKFLGNLLRDQKEIWFSPTQLKARDLRWLVPAGVVLGVSLHRDSYVAGRIALNSADQKQNFRQFSDVALYSIGATAASTYLFGHLRHSERLRETGILAGEALANAAIVRNVLGYSLGRQRPDHDLSGDFFAGGHSFPSGHASYSWAVATVIANEYPGWLTKTAMYGLATGASLGRVGANKHFVSDVLVGSAIGYGIGRFVYRRHHDPVLGGALSDPGSSQKVAVDPAEVSREVRSLASPYVPLDDWSYDAFDRLAGLGALSTNLSNMKPWTRIECARLVQEAEIMARSMEVDETHEIFKIVRALRKEFSHEYEVLDGGANRELRLESVYARVTQIEGPTLTDGYHFGQTVYNDFGRPNREGTNFIGGVSGYGVSGPWVGYVRGEYQRADSMPALPLAARQAISAFEATPLVGSEPFPEISRFRFLDAYVGYTWRKWQLSFGQQSLWWAPNANGALNFSNNAEPVPMFRISTVRPLQLPWFFRVLGPTKGEYFFGALRGHQFIGIANGPNFTVLTPPLDRQPLIQGIKVAFKPTIHFEFGVSVSTVWGGAGVPLTFRSFWRSFSAGNTSPGQPLDPGDRRSGFDFKYRIPGLRRWLTLYNDSMTEDEQSPIGYPRRSAMNSGLFLSHVPGLPKLDLRGEGFYTDLPGLRNVGSYYFNFHYLGGFTNQGNLLGHTVGRQGNGYAVFARYWLTPERVMQFTYRNLDVNRDFFQGGSIRDVGTSVRWRFDESWEVNAQVQHERWQFPVLAPDTKTNTSVRFGVRFTPGTSFLKPWVRSGSLL
jgi:membrane-associated phospholipid phosphatase